MVIILLFNIILYQTTLNYFSLLLIDDKIYVKTLQFCIIIIDSVMKILHSHNLTPKPSTNHITELATVHVPYIRTHCYCSNLYLYIYVM